MKRKNINYNVNGLENANQILSISEIRNLNKYNKLKWVGGCMPIADDNRLYFFKENNNGKALFMHVIGERTSTFFVAKFN